MKHNPQMRPSNANTGSSEVLAHHTATNTPESQHKMHGPAHGRVQTDTFQFTIPRVVWKWKYTLLAVPSRSL